MINKGHKAANVIWATGRRTDHTLTNITNIARYREELKIVILDDYSKIHLLPQKFEKWYTKNSILSLIPIGEVKGIHSKNLFYPLNNDILTLGFKTGSSNFVTEDGIVTIEHAEGHLLLIESFD